MITDDRLNEIIKEETQRFVRKFFKRKETKKLLLRVFFDPDTHSSDLLSNVRSLISVTTVYVSTKAKKSRMGKNVVDIKINYLPHFSGMSNPKYIDFLCKSIVALPPVSQVRILRIQGKRMVRPVGNLRVVYTG